MIKNDIIEKVLADMQPNLSQEQINELKNSLALALHDVDIIDPGTELSIAVDDTKAYISRFLVALAVEEKSTRTIEQYGRAANKFFTVINKNFREVTSDDALYYMAYIKKTTNNSATTRDNERRFVKAFFNYLFNNEYIYRNPFEKIKPIKKEEKKKVILTDTELEALRDACKGSVRDTAIMDFIISTGVRVSELEALNVTDVNFQTGEVSVYGIKTRTWRTVYLDARASKHLMDYIKTRTDYNPALFVGSKRKVRITKKTYEDIVKSYARKCGINKHCTIHMFRRTLVSRLHAKNILSIAEIAMIMGHSVNTLQKHYLTIDESDVRHQFMKSVC